MNKETNTQEPLAVALREALDILEKLDYAIPYVYQNRSPQNEIARLVRIAENKVREALAAPARNIDRPECRTRDEAWNVFERESAGMWAADWDAAFTAWLFATAEGKEADNG